MRKMIMAGIFSLVAFCFGSDFAQAAQVKLTWKTSVKITCDRTVEQGEAVGLFLCTDATCNTHFPDDQIGIHLNCGTMLGKRSTGFRVETPFEPTVFKSTLNVLNEADVVICSNPVEGMPVGNSVNCDGSRSPKLTVGRPH